MKICDELSCTGCLACADTCKMQAISVKKNRQGFSYPVIDDSVCVHCGKCVSVCPVNVQKKNKATTTPFACWDKDDKERKSATSGGFFTCLAKKFVEDGGVAYGAAYDSSMKVVHKRITSLNEVTQMRGSKYVQSDTSQIYKKVKADLSIGKKVLFSGTPCQVAALKNYLGKDYENLLLIDIMCHGVPSPLIYDDYRKWLENKQKSKVRKLDFRYKKPGWTVFSMKADFENGKSYVSSKYEDPYHCFFSLGGGDLTLRQSCFKCHFTSPERVGDITLADFWQYRAQTYSSRGSEKGVSLVLINTELGKRYFESVADKIKKEEHTWEEAYISNLQLTKPNTVPTDYKNFWNTYYDGGFTKVLEKYWKPDKKGKYRMLLIAWKRAHEYLFPSKK